MVKKILLTLCMIIILTSVTGCGKYFSSSLVITKYPNRLIYIAGYDRELDLTGGEIVHSFADNETIYFMDDDTLLSRPLNTSILPTITISHEIDFNVPGVYVVKIYVNGRGSDTFAIQVVDINYVNDIINQASD